MEMTNMQADMILGQLNTIYVSLTKSNEPAPCVLTVGLAKNIRKMQGELKEYFEEKQKPYRNMKSLLMPRLMEPRMVRSS